MLSEPILINLMLNLVDANGSLRALKKGGDRKHGHEAAEIDKTLLRSKPTCTAIESSSILSSKISLS